MNTAHQNGNGLSVISPFTEVDPEVEAGAGPKIHPTAIIEEDVRIGDGTAIWDSVHVREGASIGEDCIIGEKTYIAGGVKIGNRVKINSGVYIPAGVTIGDGVMIAAGAIFANDRYPRATTPDLSELRPSEVDEATLSTWVHSGATIGAGAMIVGGIEVGAFAMVGMGSVVTKPVPAFHLVLGNPGRSFGTVCRCGCTTSRFTDDWAGGVVQCPSCGMRYQIRGNQVMEFNPPVAPRRAKRRAAEATGSPPDLPEQAGSQPSPFVENGDVSWPIAD